MIAYLVILIIVFTLILLGVNIYLLMLYIHPDDKKWTRAPYAKIIVILALTFCQAQALMVPLDTANESTIKTDSINMHIFWLVFYLILFVFLCLFVPFAIFYYQSDPQDNFFRRMFRSFIYLILALLVPAFIVMLNMIQSTNFRLLYVDSFPQITVDESNRDIFPNIVQTSLNATYPAVYAWEPIAIIQVMTFIGWFFVVFFAGVGLFALPMDFINEFRFRPKVRKSSEMMAIKNKLVQAVKNLLKEGQLLKDYDRQYERNQQAGCFEKFTGNRKANSNFTRFKVKYYMLSEQFSIFNLELKLADVNPIIPILKLILGIFFLITSILWVIQIIFVNIAKNPLIPNRSLIYGLDNLFVWFDSRSANLISTIIFTYFCLYMMWCVQKGSIKLGIRLPFCCRFYPLKQKQTALNGLLMNCIYLLLGSVAVTQLCIACFPQYTRNAQAYIIFQQFVSNMGFYRIFYRYYIFPIALICWTFLSLIYLLVTCNRKPGYMKQIEDIRNFHQEELQKIE